MSPEVEQTAERLYATVRFFSVWVSLFQASVLVEEGYEEIVCRVEDKISDVILVYVVEEAAGLSNFLLKKV